MSRSTVLGAFAALTLLSGALGLSCAKTSGNDGATGNVRLALMAGGKSFTGGVINYTITEGAPAGGGTPIAPVTGTINVADPNATASAFHNFPPSTGDVAQLTATLVDGTPCTGTSVPFPVVSGLTAQVAVQLTCGGGSLSGTNDGGSVQINGTVVDDGTNGNHCPTLTSWMASPLQTSAGSSIDIGATATDGDTGETITLALGPTATDYTPPTATAVAPAIATIVSKFKCPAVVADTVFSLTVTATDSHTPAVCSSSISIPVKCIAVPVSGTGGSSAGGGGGSGTAGAGGSVAVCPPPVPGIWADLSGNGHDATLKNFGATSGLVGSGTPADPYAMRFDGIDDYAELAAGVDGLRLTSEATLEIWVNNNFAEGVNSYDTMYSNRNGNEYSGFGAAIFNPGSTADSFWDVSYTTDGVGWSFLQPPGRPPSNTWIHFVSTFSVSQGLSRLFINGVQVTSAPLTGPMVYSAAALPRVGGEAVGYNFRGEFGEVRVWSAALTPDEVVARYEASAPTYAVIAPSPTLTVTEPLALRLDATCP